MASKKYLFLAALFGMLALSTTSFGQTTSLTGSHDYLDTAYVPSSKAAQQQSFLNNQSIYPAKPRNMWELGVHGGYYSFFGNVPTLPGWAAGLSLRKALGYTFSVRGELTYGNAKGLDYRLATWPGANTSPAYNGYPSMTGQKFVKNYKSTTYTGSLDVLASLKNIMFHSSANKVDVYVLAGYSLVAYKTETDIFSSGTTPYNFGSVDFLLKSIELQFFRIIRIIQNNRAGFCCRNFFDFFPKGVNFLNIVKDRVCPFF